MSGSTYGASHAIALEAQVAETAAVLAAPANRRIYLATHIRMDGDGLGSAVALRRALEVMGKDARLVAMEPIPTRYQLMPGTEESLRIDLLPADREAPSCDVLVVTDCGEPKLLAGLPARLAPGFKVINIDHHISNQQFGDFNLVDVKASATAEIVYRVIRALGVSFDLESALGVYVGLVLDTGSFSLRSTTAFAHEIAAEMLGHGIDPNAVARRLFHSKRLSAMRLSGEFLRNMELSECGRLAWGKVSMANVPDNELEENELDDLIELPRSLAGVSLAMVLRELRDNRGTRVSLRSECAIDVNAFLARYQGGGHRRAAGVVINQPLAVVEAELVRDLLALLEREGPEPTRGHGA